MSWIQKLHETYEHCAGASQFANNPLLPVSHTVQQAHIEVSIDDQGNFLRGVVLSKESTILPATEDSAGRTSGEAPHPLSDKVQYCAADYPTYGGKKKSYYPGYAKQLSTWCQSKFSHPKAKAVLEYVRKGTVVADLVHEKLLHLGKDGKLLTTWGSDVPIPQIFKSLTAKAGDRDQGDALIRWRVETPGDPLSATWKDSKLMDAWIGFDASQNQTQGLCMVTGKDSLLVILCGYGLLGLSRRYLDGATATSGGVSARLGLWWAKANSFEKRWTVGMFSAVALSLLVFLIYSSGKSGLITHLSSAQLQIGRAHV